VLTSREDYLAVKAGLIEAGLEPEDAEVTMIASLMVELDKEGAEKVIALVDSLEDLDDVQNVYTNAEIPTEVLEQLSE